MLGRSDVKSRKPKAFFAKQALKGLKITFGYPNIPPAGLKKILQNEHVYKNDWDIAIHISPNMRSILGFLPSEKRITKRFGALKVVLFLWLPRWALAPSKLRRYSYRSPSIPMAKSRVGYSCPQSCGGIPIDPRVFLWYSYTSPSIPMAAQVGIPALKVAE